MTEIETTAQATERTLEERLTMVEERVQRLYRIARMLHQQSELHTKSLEVLKDMILIATNRNPAE